MKFNFHDAQPVFFFSKFLLYNAKTALDILSSSEPFGRHVYLTLQGKFYCRPRPEVFLKRGPKNEDLIPKTRWTKTKIRWTKTKTPWTKTKTFWTKTKTLWTKTKTPWTKTQTCWTKTKNPVDYVRILTTMRSSFFLLLYILLQLEMSHFSYKYRSK